jgi:hypothetical protein
LRPWIGCLLVSPLFFTQIAWNFLSIITMSGVRWY